MLKPCVAGECAGTVGEFEDPGRPTWCFDFRDNAAYGEESANPSKGVIDVHTGVWVAGRTRAATIDVLTISDE